MELTIRIFNKNKRIKELEKALKVSERIKELTRQEVERLKKLYEEMKNILELDNKEIRNKLSNLKYKHQNLQDDYKRLLTSLPNGKSPAGCEA